MYNISRLIFRFFCVLISSIIPKRKNVWVFGAWFGNRISDNPKHFIKFIDDADDLNLKTIWIYKDKNVFATAKSQNIQAHHYISLKGIYYQLVAKFVFVSHSISADLNANLIGWGSIRIQMWHGVPLKKIMYDNPSEGVWWKKNKIYRFVTNNYYDYLLSPSPVFNQLFCQAFDMPKSKILDTGYPRNDVFLNKKHLELENKYYRVIYMPTYRKYDENGQLLFGANTLFDIDFIQKKLADENIWLTIRIHPANCPSSELLAIIEDANNIDFSHSDDIYDEISNYDCLITDYSSIMFDFALTGKPIIFSAFDFESYLSDERSLYYNYKSITGGQEVKDWHQLISKVIVSKHSSKKILTSTFMDDVKNSFNTDNNILFSRKLINEIIRLN